MFIRSCWQTFNPTVTLTDNAPFLSCTCIYFKFANQFSFIFSKAVSAKLPWLSTHFFSACRLTPKKRIFTCLFRVKSTPTNTNRFHARTSYNHISLYTEGKSVTTRPFSCKSTSQYIQIHWYISIPLWRTTDLTKPLITEIRWRAISLSTNPIQA